MTTVEERCAKAYAQTHPVNASRRLEKMPADVSVAFLKQLPAATTRDILAAMQITAAAECLTSLPLETASPILSALPADHVVRLLRLMHRDQADVFLAAMPATRREQIGGLMRFPANTAGAMIDASVLTVSEDLTVGDAQREFRRAAGSSYYYIYVVSRDHRLVGVLDVRELFTGVKTDSIKSVMRPNPVSVPPLTDLATLAAHGAWTNVDALPVTARDGRMLGIVRHRTVRQHLRPTESLGLEHVGATVTRLGEIYWAAMGAFIATVAAVAARQTSAGHTGDHHD